jgi:hypothetical protein
MKNEQSHFFGGPVSGKLISLKKKDRKGNELTITVIPEEQNSLQRFINCSIVFKFDMDSIRAIIRLKKEKYEYLYKHRNNINKLVDALFYVIRNNGSYHVLFEKPYEEIADEMELYGGADDWGLMG